MSAQAYISFLDKHLAAFSQSLSALREAPDADKVHESRLLRKRISTALRWVEEVSDSLDARKNIHRTRDLFSALGEVRDLQIVAEMIHHYAPEPTAEIGAFHDICILTQAEALEEAIAEAELFTPEVAEKISHSVRKALKKSGETDFDIAADKYLHKLYRNLDKVARNAENEKVLHRLRARIKEVAYFIEIIEGAGHPISLSKEEIKAAHEMGDQLGKWHDLVLFYDTLRVWSNKKARKKMSDEEIEDFARLKALVKADISGLISTISQRKDSVAETEDKIVTVSKGKKKEKQPAVIAASGEETGKAKAGKKNAGKQQDGPVEIPIS